MSASQIQESVFLEGQKAGQIIIKIYARYDADKDTCFNKKQAILKYASALWSDCYARGTMFAEITAHCSLYRLNKKDQPFSNY